MCGSVLPFEEDKRHEFKAHRNICVEELPHWAFVKGTLRRSRRAVSRSVCKVILQIWYRWIHHWVGLTFHLRRWLALQFLRTEYGSICKNGPREIPVTVNSAFSALANPTIE